MQHIACFIAGAAGSLFWDDVVLIFVGSGFCNGTSRLGDGNPAGGMSLNDLELSNIDIVNLQKQDPKFSIISSEDPVYLKVAPWSLYTLIKPMSTTCTSPTYTHPKKEQNMF